ncbi:DUF4856 domain-containing protein [Marinigracilibium pacificum]|uniref:DUF4856 domain-containing protein n=1 Tax=Marinigracilibium pacificum TaxID=2729599 RepID=A0A848IXI6_9BACT|nr:DUF4856 domain-containing protein [Marinigracilibium pacificum]NMM46980.1 DUF4856 domain-containing protein [Marinigracilibium pacificum]
MKKIFLPLVFSAFIFGCTDDPVPQDRLEVPSTYNFERDGQSSVSFDGQSIRLDMLSEIKAYASLAHNLEAVEYTKLSEMYGNTNSPFSNATLNNSDKQLRNKTFPQKDSETLAIMLELANVSADVAANNTKAQQGTAGMLYRNSDDTNPILVNAKGWEYVQFIEKGLMGSVFIHQMLNIDQGYLSNTKLNVDNETLVEGKNYTTMEHHWDEAFGYWGAPIDYPSVALEPEEDRFWVKYTDDFNEYYPASQTISNAFRTGRAAIVAQRYSERDNQREIILDNLELVIVGSAIHYINYVINNPSAPVGERFHALSEAYNFVEALKYVPQPYITEAGINQILNTDFGQNGDFWTITNDGLYNAKTALVKAYPLLAPFQDKL